MREPEFRMRGTDGSRLENFSDAALGFALTLLVVSLEVPQTFSDLRELFYKVPAFAACFGILMTLWFRHRTYFRRYGLDDLTTIVLNAIFLFTILLFVYPLKFMFNLALAGFFKLPIAGSSPDHPLWRSDEDVRLCFVIYAAGFVSVHACLGAMYYHAWRQRDALGLSPVERARTREGVTDNLCVCFVPLVSVLLAYALPMNLIGLAGMVYFALAFVGTGVGMYYSRQVRRLLKDAPAA